MSKPFSFLITDAAGRIISGDECSTSDPQLWIGLHNSAERMLLNPDTADELIKQLKKWKKRA